MLGFGVFTAVAAAIGSSAAVAATIGAIGAGVTAAATAAGAIGRRSISKRGGGV